jgi:transcriptional regulator with XRE-family HTH domain
MIELLPKGGGGGGSMVEVNNLNDRLRALRLERGFTQQELGDMLGVTAQAVSKWETRISTPDINLLPKISALFKCSIDSLFNGMEVVHEREKNKTMINADFSKIESSDLRGLVMRDVNLEGAEIFDSCLNGMRIHHGGMSDLSLKNVNLDGLTIGFSLCGHMVPIRFSKNDFKRSIIDRCDLAGVEITNCNLSGVKIKGSILKDSWLLQPEGYEPIHIEDVNLQNSVIKNGIRTTRLQLRKNKSGENVLDGLLALGTNYC